MANWSILKKVLVFGGGGFLALIILAGAFGSSEKTTSSTTTTAQTGLQAKASAFGACVSKIPGVKWQTDTPNVGQPPKWADLPTDKLTFGGETIAIKAGNAVYTATPSFWSTFWVANSPADAVQAQKMLSDPNNEARTSNYVYDSGRADKYGYWILVGQTPAEEGKSRVVEFDSTPSEADLEKLDRSGLAGIAISTRSCLKKNGLLSS